MRSVFNLIDIFRRPTKKLTRVFNTKTHCEQKEHHDYYCDAEKPFLTVNE